MSNYLRKYVGKYRVIAEYDLETLDYPRTMDGNIDPSFDDLYIKCARHIKIKHAWRNTLTAYIPNKTMGKNILKQIYKDATHKEILNDDKYLSKTCEYLIKNNILTDAEVLDFEAYFTFNSDKMDYMATLLRPQVSGAKIQPYSVKNLPKVKYKIPTNCENQYKDVCKKLPQRKLKGRSIVDGLYIRKCNSEFIKSHKLKNINRMNDRNFIHSKGLWKEYIDFLKTKEVK